MRESLGGSFLLYIVIFIIGIVILFFASIISYAKAYRVKNRIINVVENSSCINPGDDPTDVYGKIIKDIDADLGNVGYSFTSSSNCNFNNNSCSSVDNFNIKVPYKGGNYNYCICKVDNGTEGYYYEVVTFTEFSFPIIKDVIRADVHGESKIMCKNYDDYVE